jgi:hypothetical protein
MARPGRRKRRADVRKYLSERELDASWEAIESALRSKKKAWGLQGWSIQGRTPRLRVVVKVPYRRVSPRRPVEPIPIAAKRKFLLKVGVEASYHSALGKPTGGAVAFGAQSFPLAAGSPIEVSSGGRSRCGVAAVLKLDGDPFLLTCGHSFGSSAGKVFLPGGNSPIAHLERNLMHDHDPLDAAICKLTLAGNDLLADSADADTWFSGVHAPESSDNGKSVAFWPTSEDEPDPIDIDVASFSVCFEPLFGAGGPTCRFIEARLPASEGDSGSVLALGDSYYGLCSGTAGSSSYFTAMADVIDALSSDFGSIEPWQPD